MAVTYEPIATTTLGSAQSSVTFSSISGSYTDLILVGSVNTTTGLDYYFQVNSDTGSNYSTTRLAGNGTTASSARASGTNKNYLNSTSTTTGWHQFSVHFMNYSNSTTYKTFLTRYDNAGLESAAKVHLWRSTSAINSINITTDSSTFTSGSIFTLYGIKAA